MKEYSVSQPSFFCPDDVWQSLRPPNYLSIHPAIVRNPDLIEMQELDAPG